MAKAACAILEEQRVRCWIAPRDITPGMEYAEAIVDGIEDCRVFIIVFSQNANSSPQVRREVERAVSKGKAILPFRVEDVAPTKAMEFCLGNTHWLDALTPPLEAHLARLTANVLRLLGATEPGSLAEKPSSPLPEAKRADEPTFEYRSEWELFGIPLLHVGLGLPRVNGKRRSPRGFLAVGELPRGLIAIGSFPIGGLAMGAFPLGVVPVGFLSIGVFAIGAIAVGLVGGYGAFVAAPIAMGWVAAGYYAFGDHLVGRWIWTRTASDPEAMRFFQPWATPWLHGALVTLCFFSYLLPRCFRLLSRMAHRNQSR